MTPSPSFDLRLFLCGALAFFAAGAVPALYGVTLPLWSETYGLAEGEGGWLLSASGAGSFLAVLAGFLGLPGLGLRTGLLALGLGAAGVGLSSAWAATLGAAFVTGFGFGLLTAAVNRLFLAGFGHRGAGMVGLVNAIYGLGAILSPLAFLAAGRNAGGAFAAVTVLTIGALAFARPDAGAAGRGLPDLRDPRLLVTLFIFGNGLIEGLSVGLGASALVGAGLAQDTAARLTSAFFVSYLLARLSLYWIARRVPARVLFIVGTAGTGVAMALAASGWPAPGYVAAGAFVGMIFPSYYVWAIGILGDDPRMTSAILTAALLGAMLSPVMIQPILAMTGEDGAFPVVAVAGLGLAGAFALFYRAARQLGQR